MALVKLIVGIILWAAILFGILHIGVASEPFGHSHDSLSICGPWGCGPPARALMGWHGFWLFLFTPPVGILIRFWPIKFLRAAGFGLSAVGVAALIGIGAWEAATWRGDQIYIVQRWLFSVVTLTDAPIIPLTLAGMAMYFGAIVKLRRQEQINPLADPSDAEEIFSESQNERPAAPSHNHSP